MKIKILLLAAFFLSFNVTVNASIIDTDHKLFHSIYDHHTKFGDAFFPVVNYFGNGEFDYALNLAYFTFGNETDIKFARINTLSLIATGLIVLGIKRAAHRKRPTYNNYNSFPSGHTAYAFAMATLWSARYSKLRIPLYLLAASTAIARIYLGKHYPSDVLVGAVIGFAIPTLFLKHQKILTKF